MLMEGTTITLESLKKRAEILNDKAFIFSKSDIEDAVNFMITEFHSDFTDPLVYTKNTVYVPIIGEPKIKLLSMSHAIYDEKSENKPLADYFIQTSVFQEITRNSYYKDFISILKSMNYNVNMNGVYVRKKDYKITLFLQVEIELETKYN